MAKRKISTKNIIFIIIIALLIIPQTRQQIQIALHIVIAKSSPSVEKEDALEKVSSYNWQLQDLEGNSFQLDQAKGKVTLVNIWATWCPPCIAEMPSLQDLYNDYSDKIEFVLVSNEKQEVIKTFLKKKNYNLKIYSPLTEAPETFNVSSIPRTFLLDREGNIIIDESGAANWNSETVRNTIDELIKL
ncbi:TlpA disulfide reductase family protein [Lacinutrix sp. Bg11-31]|uniref:TlpA family protein disulfide reductase n=1 Tax=Lacinutrix sp. Bg11-31 TaxID=2057808 RepID=UPI000C3117F9|nr:TlpA disulfide reductase family protein [Lacinutrix sp. Bg11-31]AUC82001.1 thiol-disulfide oxidoreductase [Lacinutrix sp. Bg11-31]